MLSVSNGCLAMSLSRYEKDKGSYCPHAPPPAWSPSEDYRSITTTFQYLESSGISIRLLLMKMKVAVFHTATSTLPICVQAGIGVTLQ